MSFNVCTVQSTIYLLMLSVQCKVLVVSVNVVCTVQSTIYLLMLSVQCKVLVVSVNVVCTL